mgnify:CR=1 FL=1
MFNHEPNQPDPEFQIKLFMKGVRRIALVTWGSMFLCSLGIIWQYGGIINTTLAVVCLLMIIFTYRARPLERKENEKRQ